MKELLRRLIWFIPVVHGILIGAVLWLSEDMSISQALPQWLGIAMILVIYALIVWSVPLQQHKSLQQNLPQKFPAQADAALSSVQAHYLAVMQSRKEG